MKKYLNFNEASKINGSPSRAYLGRSARKDVRPDFFVKVDGSVRINIEHPEWTEFLKERLENGKGKKKIFKLPGKGIGQKTKEKNNSSKKKNRNTKKNESSYIPNPGDEPEDYIDEEYKELRNKSRKAKLIEPILKNKQLEYKNEQELLKIQIQAKELIEYSLADFLFFGYLEKMNLELLGLTRKIAPIIDNLCKEQKPDEIIKRLNREFETILIEVKRAQAKDVENWKNE